MRDVSCAIWEKQMGFDKITYLRILIRIYPDSIPGTRLE